jgi:drug/metabolite transporter (DMT)-like permease
MSCACSARSSIPRASTPAAERGGDRDRALVLVAPVVFLLLWSGGYTAARVAIGYSGPFSLLAVRYALVVLLLAIAVAVTRPRFPRRRRAYIDLTVVALLVQAGYFGFTNLALAAGASIAVVALVGSLQPIVVAILSPFVIGERVSRRQWLGLGLGLAGAAIVILARSRIGLTLPGLAAAVGSVLAISGGTLYERRHEVSQDPVVSNSVQYAVGLAVMVPLALVFEGGIRLTPAPAFWISLGYLAIGNSLISITLLLAMVRAGHVARVSALFFLVPPLSALYALLLLHEQLSVLGWAGMAVAAVGVALVTLGRRD